MLRINTIYNIDVLQGFKQLDDNSIDCVVTSPPYWSLRDYGVKGQLGLEPTIGEYIDKLLKVFDEAKRVLKDTGTLWINIGDSYNSYKCLLTIPFRFAIEMINRGWILRNTIIWHKSNALPSSAKDRFTVDFEYIFFFTKNKKYYFKQLLELANYDGRKKQILEPTRKYKNRNYTKESPQQMARNPMLRWPNTINGQPARNKRTTWSIPTQPFKGAHFAVFPEKLIEPMIQAGCPKNGIVLDPFMGSGTTAVVAKKLGCNYIGFELNSDYVAMAIKRLQQMEAFR